MLRSLIAAALALACVTAADDARAFGLGARAERHVGASARQLGLPPRLWCADFMNMLLGRRGADRRAVAYRSYGSPASAGCTDCIAVIAPWKRGRRWHVGVVVGYDANSNPVIVSGNHGRKVGKGVYPRAAVKAWRVP